jgi:excisionase family DNA binding protein
MSEVCSRFSVHPNTVRRATEAGDLKCVRLGGLSHRRFRECDVLEWLGVEREEEGNGGDVPIALVARVSSAGQARARSLVNNESDLDRQLERLTTFAREKWGHKAKLFTYKRVASGMLFSHPVLHQLIKDVLAGKFKGGFVISTYPDRLLRFGAELFRSICEFGGATLLFTESAADVSEEEELCNDVLAVITHFSAKSHGRRATKRVRTIVPEDLALYIVKLSSAGYSNRHIAKRLKGEGKGADENGRPITDQVVARVLKEQSATLRTVQVREGENNFALFFSCKLRRASEKTRLARKTMLTAYYAWAKQRGEVPLSDKQISKWIRSHLPEVHQSALAGPNGERVYAGLSLLKDTESVGRENLLDLKGHREPHQGCA